MLIDRRTVIIGAATLAAVGTAESATPDTVEVQIAQLQKSNIEVKVDPEKYPYGRFARLHDPEGNPIELWEPAGRDLFR